MAHTEHRAGILEETAREISGVSFDYWTLYSMDTPVTHVLDPRFRAAYIPAPELLSVKLAVHEVIAAASASHQ